MSHVLGKIYITKNTHFWLEGMIEHPLRSLSLVLRPHLRMVYEMTFTFLGDIAFHKALRIH